MARFNFFILIVFLLAGAATAQEAKPAKKARDIQFEADQVDYDQASKLVRMVGKVKFISEGST